MIHVPLDKRQMIALEKLREMIAVAEADVAAGRVGTFDRDAIIVDVQQRFAAHIQTSPSPAAGRRSKP